MIIDEIKKDNVRAMKEHDATARAIYGVVMNKVLLNSIELKKDGKEQTDNDVIQILQKTIKELTEERENYIKVKNIAEAENIEKQQALISKFLPKMLSEEEIRKIIDGLPDKNIPTVMRYFKEHYAGKVDMGLVNRIARG